MFALVRQSVWQVGFVADDTVFFVMEFQVKRIVMQPGQVLSLRSHCSEHWIVVGGSARVTMDDKTRLVIENESVYVPPGTVRRMEPPGRVPMVLIEIQTGAYVGEDDIVRHEGIRARVS